MLWKMIALLNFCTVNLQTVLYVQFCLTPCIHRTQAVQQQNTIGTIIIGDAVCDWLWCDTTNPNSKLMPRSIYAMAALSRPV